MTEFNINVKVSLEEASLQRLGQVLSACVGGCGCGCDRQAPPARPAVVETRPAAPAQPVQTPAPAASESIDNMTLNAAVKAALDKGAQREALIGIFDEFGIKSARECPPERRPDLHKRISSL